MPLNKETKPNDFIKQSASICVATNLYIYNLGNLNSGWAFHILTSLLPSNNTDLQVSVRPVFVPSPKIYIAGWPDFQPEIPISTSLLPSNSAVNRAVK